MVKKKKGGGMADAGTPRVARPVYNIPQPPGPRPSPTRRDEPCSSYCEKNIRARITVRIKTLTPGDRRNMGLRTANADSEFFYFKEPEKK